MTNVVPMQRNPKWVDPPVHPCNNAPMMSEAEIDELAKDIKENGLQEPIVYWEDNREEANGAKGPFPKYLLDGRNRREALRRLGVEDPNRAKFGKLVCSTAYTVKAVKEVWTLGRGGKTASKWEADVDPETFHLSANVYRRHLTQEQRRWEVKRQLMANPETPSAVIAQKAGVGLRTVEKIRKSEKIGQPSEIKRQKIRKEIARNPSASTDAIAKKLGTSWHIVENVRHAHNAKPRQKSKLLHKSDIAAAMFVKWIIERAEPSELPQIAKWLDCLSPKTQKVLLRHMESGS